mmetsp:Transcript_377/g.1059  ORF Transcript_377/g.1059 Transcript_377/m.1059 type:complete len:237 (+) Transcript_377:182-892(+)
MRTCLASNLAKRSQRYCIAHGCELHLKVVRQSCQPYIAVRYLLHACYSAQRRASDTRLTSRLTTDRRSKTAHRMPGVPSSAHAGQLHAHPPPTAKPPLHLASSSNGEGLRLGRLPRGPDTLLDGLARHAQPREGLVDPIEAPLDVVELVAQPAHYLVPPPLLLHQRVHARRDEVAHLLRQLLLRQLRLPDLPRVARPQRGDRHRRPRVVVLLLRRRRLAPHQLVHRVQVHPREGVV